MPTTIYPTHQCFDDVLTHQHDLARHDPATAARQRIVHGVLLFPHGDARAGQPFAHAWVEDPATLTVWQSGRLADGRAVWFGIPAATFLQTMRVQSSTAYTLSEARILNWQTEHFGPWIPAYRALCRDGGGT